MKKSFWLRSSQLILLIVFCLLLVACSPLPPTGTPVALDGTPTPPQETPDAAPSEMGSWPLSPDQHLMVAQTHDGAWWMWDTSTRRPVYLLNDTSSHKPPMHHPTFSPDGHYLAAISIGHVLLWEVASRKRRMLISPVTVEARSINQLVFSPNSQLLAANGCEQLNSHFVCTGGFITVWNTADGTLTHTLGTGFRVDSMTFNADSNLLTASGCSRTDGVLGVYCYENATAIFNVVSGERIALTQVPQFR